MKEEKIIEIVLWVCLIFVLVYYIYEIFIWRYFNDKENSAPPIVIDKSNTKKNLEGALFTNNQNIPSIDTGYNDVSLNNPCDLDNPEALSNNIPNGRRVKKCAKGLKCVSGVVKGGNICLLENGETCLSSRSCAPPYSCINGICQEKTEIINKPCDDNSDCQVDGIYRFNHVCYKESNSVKGICKYDIYPLDSGCRNKDECRFSNSTLNEVSCITDVDLEKIEGTSVIFYSGIDGASDKRFGTFVSLNNDVDFLKNRNSSIKLEYSSGSNFNTCRVLNVKGTSVLLSCDAEIINSSKYYISDVKLKGICLVDYPLGTSPPTIPHYDEKYPCVTGASTFGGDFCVETSRGKNGVLGKNNQICQQTSIPCDKSLGLDCTFNNNVFSNISVNYNTEDGFINHTPINSIGKCFHQTQRYLEPCSNNLQCIAPNICINGRCKTSEYPFKSTNLINCPDKYKLSANETICLGEKDQPFLEPSDCVNPSKGLSNRIVSFNNDSTNFSQLYPPISEEFSNPKILMSKTKSTNSDNPSAFGFYNLNDNNGVSSRFTIGVSNYKFNINFPSSEILDKDKINLSIFEKGDGNHRLNISYIKEYETYRLRLYDLDYNNPGCSIYSTYGIYEGACVAVAIASEHNKYYFIQAPDPFTYLDAGSSSADSTTGIVTWDYSPSGGDFFGIPDSTLTAIKNEGLSMYLATYSSKYSVVGEEGSDKFLLFNLMPPNNTDTVQENLDNPNYINLGDVLKYHKAPDDIDFLPGNHPLIDGDLFTAVIGPSSQNSIVGTSVNRLFLTQNNINAGLSIGISESNGKFGYKFDVLTFPYDKSPSFDLSSNFGVNVLMYDIDETTPVNSDINIELSEKNNLFDTGLEFNTLGTSSLQNNPIGYFSGLSTFNDINLEIDENNIFLNYNLSKEISYTLGISYGTSENIGTCESYSENRFYSFNSYSENSTPKTNVISYKVNNNFCPPKIKTSLNVEIDETIRFPNYEIDRVQNYKNISDKNKVDVLVNYKNIETTSLEFPVLIESELYKIDSKGVSEYSGSENMFTIKNFYYSNSDGSKNINPSPSNSSDLEPTFRYSTPIRIQNFTEDSSSNNFYSLGTYQITIKEKLAIDVILKYSGSEIVIGFYSSSNIKHHWIITKVIDYTVSTSEEYLILQINVSPLESISYKDLTPYLFVNNIIPLDLIENNASDIKLTDGNCFKTSCINKNNTFPNRTYYDKIGYYEDTNNSPNFKNVLGGVSSSDPRSENPYFSDLEIGGTSLTLSNIKNKTGTSPVAINNLFLNFIYKPIPVNFSYNSYFPNLNFNKNYIDFKEGTSIGGINLFVNTIPYYSGTSSFYPLDNSYKEQIFYSTERTENPFGDDSGKINIQKLIINNNPGNMLNEMSYYLFYSDNSKNYFTYINSNFSQNSNILNTSPVLNLQNGTSSKKYQENSFMTPYDKKLYILGETCNG